MPTNLTYKEAAAIPFGGNTALHFLKQGNIQRGQRVLIYGASGAVGTYAEQLAKYFGAEVTGVCSTSSMELAKSLGADRVIDYTRDDFAKDSETYHVIFDTVGKSPFSDCMRSLEKQGVYLQAVALPPLTILMVWTSMKSSKTLIGGTANPSIENLNLLINLAEEKKIIPVIDRVYPFEQITEAHRYVDKGHKKGSVVIAVAPSGMPPGGGREHR
jgi:NADPH:quinone reductase-like Zn-dependent oxidoreductase